MATLLWLQGGACSGNTMSFFNAEEPSMCDLVTDFGIEILWHPSLGMALGDGLQSILANIIAGRQPLDVLVFEGTVILGPGGSGRMNMFAGQPMKTWLQQLAPLARYVVAIGDCACWGGIPATPPNPTDSTGLQFHKTRAGGFLGRNFRGQAGLPVKGRDTMGVKFVGVKGTDAVGAIALYPESDSDETSGPDQGSGDAENGAAVGGEGSVGDDVASQVTEPTTEENADE